MEHRWYAHKMGRSFYADSRWAGRLHRFLINYKFKLVDHRDRYGLNNRHSNLRKADRSQKGQNQGVSKTNVTGCKGVSLNKRHQRFHARASINGKHYVPGSYLNFPEEAVYNPEEKKTSW